MIIKRYFGALTIFTFAKIQYAEFYPQITMDLLLITRNLFTLTLILLREK